MKQINLSLLIASAIILWMFAYGYAGNYKGFSDPNPKKPGFVNLITFNDLAQIVGTNLLVRQCHTVMSNENNKEVCYDRYNHVLTTVGDYWKSEYSEHKRN